MTGLEPRATHRVLATSGASWPITVSTGGASAHWHIATLPGP